jgi:TPR repeat protein
LILGKVVLQEAREKERGYPDAQYQLARVYARGEATPRDPARAERWLRVAALANHGQAAYELANMLSPEHGARAEEAQGGRLPAAPLGVPDVQPS